MGGSEDEPGSCEERVREVGVLCFCAIRGSERGRGKMGSFLVSKEGGISAAGFRGKSSWRVFLLGT